VGHRTHPFDRERKDHAVDRRERFIALGFRRLLRTRDAVHDPGGLLTDVLGQDLRRPEKVADG
jgi:hypothetical protein